ncbi:HTH-type transcriptional activator Btr [Marinomonas spartinae]|nr:HTH-type transcriptional activator Btr [Marinomonas spartinae]
MYPTPELFNEVLADVTLASNNAPFFTQAIMDDPLLVNPFRLIFSELKSQPSKLKVEMLVYAFLIKLTLNQYTIKVKDRSRKDTSNIHRVKEYIHAYAHQDVGLEELSSIAGLSKYHLIRQFGSVFGITPHQYLIQFRIQKAKQRLNQGDIPAQVALSCGFCDQSHMNTYFKKALGVTPALYQKQISS